MRHGGFHPVCWYRRTISRAELEQAGHRVGRRLLIYFGAVDHTAEVWLDGVLLGRHEGGQSPFTMDATVVVTNGESWALVVRAAIIRGENQDNVTS